MEWLLWIMAGAAFAFGLGLQLRMPGIIPTGPFFVIAAAAAGMALAGSGMDRKREIAAQLTPVARFVTMDSDGFSRIVADRETGCIYRLRSHTPILRSDGTPDCDPSRIVPGLAEKRAEIIREIEEANEGCQPAWWQNANVCRES